MLAINRKVPFSEVLLVEGERKLADALRRRVDASARVIEGDCNDASVIKQLRDRLGHGRLARR